MSYETGTDMIIARMHSEMHKMKLGLGVIVEVSLLLALACTQNPDEALISAANSTPAETCPAKTATATRLRFGVIRYGSSTYIHAGYEPLVRYLQEHLGMPVDLVVVEHYDSIVSALARREMDLAFLTPVAYVKAKEKDTCLQTLATRVQDGAFHYAGYVVTRRDAGFSDLRQLAGKRIALVAPSSASGYVFPMQQMIAAGLDPKKDFANILFVGDHSAVLRAVVEGRADAGATWSKALQIEGQAGLDIGSLQILGITGHIPNDVMVARSDLDSVLIARVMTIMLGLNTMTDKGREALSLMFDVNGFVAVDDAFYDSVRQTMSALRRAGVSL